MGINKSRFQQADTDAFLWVQRKFCKKTYMPIVRMLSRTGDGWLYAIIAFSLLGYDYQQHQNFFYSCLLGFALEVPLYMILKNKFKRNRPQDYLQNFQAKINPSDQFSFPSGHTAAAFVMAVQILIFFPAFAILAIAWATMIGFCRILLGVHFPGDIFAGVMLGVLCSFLAGAIIL
ncbi:phosphatase PAP2 family protein [Aliikangiella coralliicola]|uniref:undecaprenyl-diphosphate phosphatase n=1 Tax=Aliikangiella coralliicola TaxID=2592383 RepID=A0A545UBM3_9GAMM|nr:phosphatase PAP2 family protein [Aliikangiella coralliicola]TQV86857.1 phosphatase PAP2 family protein [Aliikangiella coralliicola]